MQKLGSIFLFFVFTQFVLSCSADPSVRGTGPALQEIANGTRDASTLTVTYDDMHGLWGGVTILISGAGPYERRERKRGEDQTQVKKTLTPAEVRQLVELLIQTEAWKQETPERVAVSDESRARLTVRVGDNEAAIWEWYNDMKKNNRLTKVRDKMLQLGN